MSSMAPGRCTMGWTMTPSMRALGICRETRASISVTAARPPPRGSQGRGGRRRHRICVVMSGDRIFTAMAWPWSRKGAAKVTASSAVRAAAIGTVGMP